jgi:hypothetical protein
MTWVIFYPATMWMTLTKPLKMMEYSEVEQTEPSEQQYTDTLSPPLFLLLSLLIAHALEIATHTEIYGGGGVGAEIVKSQESLLLFRGLAYSIFPLMFAVVTLRQRGRHIDREHLRAPFYSQCYVAAPFALIVGIAVIFLRAPKPIEQIGALIVIGTAMVWYLTVQTLWFAAHLSISRARAWLLVAWTFVKSLAIVFAVAFLVFSPK